MGRQVVSVRLDADTVEQLDGYARGEGISRTEAVESLIRAGIAASEQQDAEPRERATGGTTEGEAAHLREVADLLRQNNTDLRQQISTLTAELSVKNEQLTRAHDLADHAQQLHAAEVTRALPPDGGTTGASVRDRIAAIFGRRARQ